MKKRVHAARYPAILVLALATFLGTGFALNFMQQGQPQQQPDQRRAPDQTQQAPPDSQAQSQSGQTFTGTIVKSGEKYVLQEDTSGTTYDVDHQAEVKKFEGKKVRIHGTLDPNGKLIHIQ